MAPARQSFPVARRGLQKARRVGRIGLRGQISPGSAGRGGHLRVAFGVSGAGWLHFRLAAISAASSACHSFRDRCQPYDGLAFPFTVEWRPPGGMLRV